MPSFSIKVQHELADQWRDEVAVERGKFQKRE